jgi:Spermidine synthase tetramerisation domain
MAVNEVHPTHHDETIEAQRAKMSFIFREDVAPGLRLEMDLNQIFFAGESDFQKIDVVDTYFGKVRDWLYVRYGSLFRILIALSVSLCDICPSRLW